jgi:hypothetical protein
MRFGLSTSHAWNRVLFGAFFLTTYFIRIKANVLTADFRYLPALPPIHPAYLCMPRGYNTRIGTLPISLYDNSFW